MQPFPRINFLVSVFGYDDENGLIICKDFSGRIIWYENWRSVILFFRLARIFVRPPAAALTILIFIFIKILCVDYLWFLIEMDSCVCFSFNFHLNFHENLVLIFINLSTFEWNENIFCIRAASLPSSSPFHLNSLNFKFNFARYKPTKPEKVVKLACHNRLYSILVVRYFQKS